MVRQTDTTTHEPLAPQIEARIQHLIRAYGVSANAFQILEPGYRYFFEGSPSDAESVIAYVETSRWWVVAGGPIGPLEDVARAFQGFVAQAHAQKKSVILMGVEPTLLKALEPVLQAYSVIKIGEQPEWNVQDYSIDGSLRRTVRTQVNRARNKGVQVRRVDHSELVRAPGVLRLQIQYIMDKWLASRRVAPLRFMVNLEPFLYPEERRYYVAEKGTETVGFLAAVPVYGRKGWFFEDVIRVPDAPNGTGESLIHHAMVDVRDHGEDYATLGLSPLSGIQKGTGDDRVLRWGLRQASKRLEAVYGFDGLRRFKARFKPDRWVPQYAIMPQKASRISAVWAIVCAFAPDSIVRFVYESFRRIVSRVNGRVWSCLLALQLAILLPWTALLSVADGAAWFGDSSIKWAWVVFNSILSVCLLGLTRLLWLHHPAARRVSMFLAGATMTDGVVSTVQAIQLHTEVSGWAFVFVVLGVVGPYLATFFLWCIAIATPAYSPRRSERQ